MAKRNLLAAAAMATAVATTPAAAATVLNQALNVTVTTSYSGSFDLSGVLSDGDGRTFSVTSAHLSVAAYSDPSYSRQVFFTSRTPSPILVGIREIDGQQVVVFEDQTIDAVLYVDDVSDGALLSAHGETVLGFATQHLNETGSTLLSSTEGEIVNGLFGPQMTITTHYEQYVRSAVYGPIDLSVDVTGGALFGVNALGRFDFIAFPSLLAAPNIRLTGASLTLELQQTGGPAPGVGLVPEPATWATMILGFAAAGAALRRRSLSPAPSRARRRRRSFR